MNPQSHFVALLRGINVGGRNKVSMPELKSSLASLGLEDVVTYIQSGNVVFRSPTGDRKKLAARMERQIAEAFGVSPTVLLRTPSEPTTPSSSTSSSSAAGRLRRQLLGSTRDDRRPTSSASGEARSTSTCRTAPAGRS